jgi:hypothetical protein
MARRGFLVPEAYPGDIERLVNLPVKPNDFLGLVFDPDDPFGPHNSFVPYWYFKKGELGDSKRLYLRLRNEPNDKVKKSRVVLPPMVMYDAITGPLGNMEAVRAEAKKDAKPNDVLKKTKLQFTFGNVAPHPSAVVPGTDVQSVYYAAFRDKWEQMRQWVFAVVCHPEAETKITPDGDTRFTIAGNAIASWAANMRDNADRQLAKQLKKATTEEEKLEAQAEAELEKRGIWKEAMAYYAPLTLDTQYDKVHVLKGDRLPPECKQDGLYTHQGSTLRVAGGVGWHSVPGRYNFRLNHSLFQPRFENKGGDAQSASPTGPKTFKSQSVRSRKRGQTEAFSSCSVSLRLWLADCWLPSVD